MRVMGFKSTYTDANVAETQGRERLGNPLTCSVASVVSP
jgi:hypothetical protein